MLNETINILNDLNLYGLKNSISNEIDYITNNNLPFLEGLNHFLKNELKYREINRAEANIKVAHFPYIKEIKDFDFDYQPSINKDIINDLSTLRFIEEKKNVLFLGSPGVGKTHLSMAYGNSCCRKGLRAYFIKATELNEKFTKARRTGTESSAISGLVRPSCLIIDEIGRSIFDMENTRLFFDMIDRRCSKEGPNCIIFTSNLTPDKWRDFFREEDALLCALDRTFDAATVYLMKGESYRGRNLKTYSIEISDPAE